ncbi:HEAT repeat domain-containing protein [Rossellomorea aquimaris]|uniref:HEAT repeat domain-containing protein n=1 Tax=Rossellomorea aquimaris TaxID=189382 RepID=UPI001CD61F43|nr:HEAT repeat domain-containing protein [Rossellomorea aquimaris]MCA1055398.1 HEAT repeat domain-containing protein [Rossellomorea aquimaris]
MFGDEIFYFSVVLVSLLLILLLLFSYLLIRKLTENNRRARVEKLKEDYRLALFQYLKEERDEFPVNFRSPLEVKALLELTSGFAKVLGGDAVRERIREFAETRFQSYIFKGLTHRRWSIRMNALYWIEEFNMRNMTVPLTRLYDSAKLTKSEEVQLLKIYIMNDDADIPKKLIDPRHPLTEFDYGSLFQSMSGQQLDRFIGLFEELPLMIRYALIESIGIRGRQSDSPFLQGLLDDQSVEIRIRALKAIVEMEYYLAPTLLTKHLVSSSWQERLMAIKACEFIRSPELLSYLEDLIGDQSFYVRSQAAQALLRLDSGKELLRQVAATREDTYARDMAEQWLERGSV